MTVGKTSAPVEQLTISVDDTPQGGTLRIEWGTVSARTTVDEVLLAAQRARACPAPQRHADAQGFWRWPQRSCLHLMVRSS